VSTLFVCSAPLRGATDGETDTPRIGVVSESLQGREGLRIQTLCTHCNSANVQVGGLSRDLVPMSRDGFPLVGGLATSMVLAMLPADSIAEAQVVRGPGEAGQSHAAAGGEVNLVGSTASEIPGFDLSAETGSYSLRQATARAAGRLASWASASAIFGVTEADPVDDDDDGWNDVPGVDRRFADAAVTLTPSRPHELLFGASYIDEENPFGRGAFDAVRFITEGVDGWTREDASFERTELRTGWNWKNRSGGTFEFRSLAARRNQTQASQLTAQTSGFFADADRLIDRFRIEENNLWANAVYEQPFGIEWRMTVGVEASRQRVDAANREPLAIISGREIEPQLAVETVDLFSTFLDLEWNPTPRVGIQLGLRHDRAEMTTALSAPQPQSSLREESEISPRLTLRYYPGRAWTLRFVAGDTFRPPTPILAEVCCGQRYQTTELVRAERGTTAGLEVVFAPTPRFRASAYLARTEFEDHILRLVGWSQVFIQTYALANVPRSIAERAELALRWSPAPRWQLDASAGWLSFENSGASEVDLFVTPPSFGAPQRVPIRIDRIPYQPIRSGSVAARVELARRTVLSFQASYTGSMWIQQFNRLPQNSTLDRREMRRTPEFWLLNLTTEIPLNRRVSLLATINNLTNEIQNDLSDPTTDYNWGPLAGRSWRAGLKVHLGG
jgi:outer membrane receptor protein involved in Fe transport